MFDILKTSFQTINHEIPTLKFVCLSMQTFLLPKVSYLHQKMNASLLVYRRCCQCQWSRIFLNTFAVVVLFTEI